MKNKPKFIATIYISKNTQYCVKKKKRRPKTLSWMLSCMQKKYYDKLEHLMLKYTIVVVLIDRQLRVTAENSE